MTADGTTRPWGAEESPPGPLRLGTLSPFPSCPGPLLGSAPGLGLQATRSRHSPQVAAGGKPGPLPQTGSWTGVAGRQPARAWGQSQGHGVRGRCPEKAQQA